MSTANRIRWGGLAAVAAGLLYVIGIPGTGEGAGDFVPVVPVVTGNALSALAGLLSAFALLGLSAHDAGRSGKLGKMGLVITMIGATLLFIGNGIQAILQVQGSLFQTSRFISIWSLSLLIGLLLLGISTLRAKVFPRWSALTIILAPVILYLISYAGLVIMLGIALVGPPFAPQNFDLWTRVLDDLVAATVYMDAGALGVPWVVLGYALWSAKGESASKAHGAPPAML